jgi:hypothetical protein
MAIKAALCWWGDRMLTDEEFKHLMTRLDLQKAGLNPNAKVSTATLVEFSKAAGESMGALLKRIKKLESQLSRLEHLEKHSLQWRGDWESGISFPPSCVVRHSGELYVSLIETTLEPGTRSAPWDQI